MQGLVEKMNVPNIYVSGNGLSSGKARPQVWSVMSLCVCSMQPCVTTPMLMQHKFAQENPIVQVFRCALRKDKIGFVGDAAIPYP
jgi:hypothetical protein